MFVYCLANKLLIFIKSCFYYLLYNRYNFSCILLRLKVEYNLETRLTVFGTEIRILGAKSRVGSKGWNQIYYI